MNKVKVNDNALITSPSGDFEVTNGGRLDLPANGTSINFTNKSKQFWDKMAMRQILTHIKLIFQVMLVKIRLSMLMLAKNIWNRYISGYDQAGLTK